MEKQINYKLFELETHQVLVKKSWDPETSECEVHISTSVENGEVTMKLSFDTEEKRDICFNDYTQEKADSFIKDIIVGVELGDEIKVTKIPDDVKFLKDEGKY